MKFIPLLINILFTICCIAQNKNSVWVFGDSSGIDFGSNPPVPITTALNSRGTCASISDNSGNLLFYGGSDVFANLAGHVPLGQIYDRTGNPMQNGDSLNFAAWYHEMIILPFPNNSSLFYVFYVGVTDLYGLYYSVIDLTQNNGLGAITIKNNQLSNLQAGDYLQAVKHANGRDWWIIFREWQTLNNNFYLYLLDPSGIQLHHIDAVGDSTLSGGGDLRFNPSGDQFAFCNWGGFLALYNFDRCSGQVSLRRTISQLNPNNNYFFDLCYSPNGNVLYVASAPYFNNQIDTAIYITRYNLTVTNIYGTRKIVAYERYPQTFGAVRLGPDNKIYVAAQRNEWPHADTSYYPGNMNLSVIHDPNNVNNCDYRPYSFYLGGKRTYWGLPNNPDYELGPVVGSSCDTIYTSLATFGDESMMDVFPNPTTDKVNIRLHDSRETITVQFINASGQLLLSKIYSDGEGWFDVSIYPSGVYSMIVQSETKRIIKKLVIK